MICFLLPNTNVFTYKYIVCDLSNNKPTAIISNSLSNYLYEIKEKINNYDKEWDVYKKYTNPYEYIHTVLPIKKMYLSNYKPLSRSYYKMIEIIQTFHLNNITSPIKTFHLAEGPGGFIEATLNIRKNTKDIYTGMTILNNTTDTKIPTWKTSSRFLNENPNVYIENGHDNTGNILSLKNFVYCVKKYNSSMDIITADGGFDFSVDFNSQEYNISKLLFAQVCYALCMQKHNGCFILKIFDCFMPFTIDIIYILSSFYKKVYITKPLTSRCANSEKYLVCKSFLHKSNYVFYPYFYNALKTLLQTDNSTNTYIYRFLDSKMDITQYFLTKLGEYNSIFGQQQLENIHYTLNLIEMKHKNEKIENMITVNIQKCVNWCIKYNIPFNILVLNHHNIYLENSNSANHPQKSKKYIVN